MQNLVLETKTKFNFEWINERIEPICEDNNLINLKIELNRYQKQYNEWINNNSSSISELRLERQSIQCFLIDRDENMYSI